ncbi:hypothetical protein FRAAL6547 [Frankia alni ACN14a]|uniref:Uncharacterized protein n=1 Tax=Frankia alni (strain DSM 45986 / CECT 9034 / ACN14a) TaxID=326424 RepID=Q0RBL4_FRAAA|nr:hypothetical protein FRAAL6547 [Frankia alni ACN14a]
MVWQAGRTTAGWPPKRVENAVTWDTAIPTAGGVADRRRRAPDERDDLHITTPEAVPPCPPTGYRIRGGLRREFPCQPDDGTMEELLDLRGDTGMSRKRHTVVTDRTTEAIRINGPD